ncbi:hypothetical protein BD410DRAFT_784026 [Rickenella mellea]|uniref:DUF6699 domain-containing protein n=1 Tax=Rickenella mellea TaxID=50990 RepID=A0A4Y7QEA7_9AGAM|nr:hypothetical protein BD410DRAFT_784026 [Rickenella mellea]
MPDKHVHWADVVQEYPPPPRTPSPTWSDDSLPDTSSPRTPPSALPVATLPLKAGKGIKVNPLLSCDEDIPPRLTWDVYFDPSTCRLSAEELAQHATEPPMKHMEIQCGALTLWRPVQIIASDGEAGRGITINDVLQGVYHYLQRAVSAEEWAHFAYMPGMQKHISESFHRRCERMDRLANPEEQAVSGLRSEKEKGLKRVDCLFGVDRFVGLTNWGKDLMPWQLHLTSRGDDAQD